MIPVEVTQTPWHYTTFWDWVDHWQTIIAGGLALVAAWLTIRATKRSADREIAASQAQIDTTVRLERERVASEASAFHVMLAGAMDRVRDETAFARRTYGGTFTQKNALLVRQSITKGGFAELRAACVRQGGDLTSEFLELEREIDNFASQWEDTTGERRVQIRMGKLAGLDEQLASIERKAAALRKKAAERFSGSVAAPGPFATAEAEAIGAPAPAEPEPRRSWLRRLAGWWSGVRAAS